MIKRVEFETEEIHTLILIYYDLFDEKHSDYISASRLRQKEHARIKRRERKNEV